MLKFAVGNRIFHGEHIPDWQEIGLLVNIKKKPKNAGRLRRAEGLRVN